MLVPPDCSEEPFDLDWEGIAATLQTFPVEYELRPAGKDEGEEATPLIPLVCHRVKVLRSEVIQHLPFEGYLCHEIDDSMFFLY